GLRNPGGSYSSYSPVTLLSFLATGGTWHGLPSSKAPGIEVLAGVWTPCPISGAILRHSAWIGGCSIGALDCVRMGPRLLPGNHRGLRDRGFTLVEVLVALVLTITASIGVATLA